MKLPSKSTSKRRSDGLTMPGIAQAFSRMLKLKLPAKPVFTIFHSRSMREYTPVGISSWEASVEQILPALWPART